MSDYEFLGIAVASITAFVAIFASVVVILRCCRKLKEQCRQGSQPNSGAQAKGKLLLQIH